MDRLAIISDIHGNMPALDSVLADIASRGITRIICLGDLAGKGPEPAQAVDRIRTVCETVVKGNWDHIMTTWKDRNFMKWNRDQLGEERLAYLFGLPIYKEFYMSGRLIRLCHASPVDLFHRVHLHTDAEERMRLFAPTPTLDQESDVVGYGDIHGAHVDHFSGSHFGKMIFNAGSVGNPLEITQASYAILEGVEGETAQCPFVISLVRVPYDIEEAVRRAERSDMPHIGEYIREVRTGEYCRRDLT